MQWALVCNEPMTTWMWVWNGLEGIDWQQIWTEVNAPANTIINLIVYDGVAEYTPAEGLRLMQVADGLNVGDVVE